MPHFLFIPVQNFFLFPFSSTTCSPIHLIFIFRLYGMDHHGTLDVCLAIILLNCCCSSASPLFSRKKRREREKGRKIDPLAC